MIWKLKQSPERLVNKKERSNKHERGKERIKNIQRFSTGRRRHGNRIDYFDHCGTHWVGYYF